MHASLAGVRKSLAQLLLNMAVLANIEIIKCTNLNFCKLI